MLGRKNKTEKHQKTSLQLAEKSLPDGRVFSLSWLKSRALVGTYRFRQAVRRSMRQSRGLYTAGVAFSRKRGVRFWGVRLATLGLIVWTASALYVFLTPTYASSAVINQSAYRWFGNQDNTDSDTWALTLGGSFTDLFNSVIVDDDGNYVATGVTSSFGAGGTDIVVSKFNAAGVEQWTKTWGGSGSDVANEVIQDTEGNYVIVGTTDSYGAGGSDVLVVKFNTNGVEQWSKTLGNVSTNEGYSIIQDQNSDYVITGRYSGGLVIAKFNTSGIEQWTKTLGSGTDNIRTYAIIETQAGDYVVTGETSASGAGSADILLAKFNSSGVEQWTKTLGSASTDRGYDVLEDSSGNYVLTGETIGLGAGNWDVIVAKFSSSGVEQWTKTWGGVNAEFGHSIVESSPDTYLITGNTNSYGNGIYDVYLIELNSLGEEQWTTTWGGSNSDYATSVEVSESVVAVAGFTYSYGVGTYNSLVVKLNGNGQMSGCTQCQSQATAEADQALTEGNFTTTEVNQTITEGNVTITEADQSVRTTAVCGLEVSWAKVWGGASDEYGYSVVEDSAGDLVSTGWTNSMGAGNQDAYIAKHSSSGVEQWTKTWGGIGSEQGRDIIEDSSGNFVITGWTGSYGAGQDDMFIAKFNSSGVEQWSKTWGGGSDDLGYYLIEDSAGNYLVAGWTFSYGDGQSDAMLVKFNSSGVEQWSKTWGGNGVEQAHSVIEDSAGDYVMAGVTSSMGAGNDDIFITKFNSSGVEQWSKTWGGTGNDQVPYLMEDSNGDYIMTGQSASYGNGWQSILVKFNSSGVEQWSKTWGGADTELGRYLVEDAEGNYLVVGYSRTYTSGNEDIYLTQYNSSGVARWTKTWGGSGQDAGLQLILNSSGEPIIIGRTQNYGGGGYDALIIKTTNDASGCGGICKSYTVTETNQTVTEGNHTITEGNVTIAESDQAVTEANQTITEVIVNETVGLNPVNVGSALAATNMAADTPSQGTPFRLRLLNHITTADLPNNQDTFKLQYALKSGTCDTSFIGESYRDVGTGGEISFYNNTNATSGAPLTTNASDPTHGSDPITNLTYVESNTFENDYNWVTAGDDGMWDFALVDNSAPGSSGYCFRMVYSDGTPLSTYTVIPELTTASASFTQADYRWFENSVPSGAGTFAKTWGGSADDIAVSVAQDIQGSIVVVGYTANFGGGGNDALISKLNTQGELEWSVTWGDTGNDVASDVAIDRDGNYIVVMQTNSYGAGSTDMGLVKFDPSGNEIWSKTWGGTGFEYGTAVVVDENNDYVVVGDTQDTGGNGYDPFITKFNSSGVEQWSKRWGSTPNDFVGDVTTVSDGGYVITGYERSYGAGTESLYIVKFDTSGVEQWTKTWEGAGYSQGTSIIEDSSGNIVVTGYADSYGAGSTDTILVKFSSTGSEIWTKTWGGSSIEYGRGLIENNQGNYAVIGYTSSFGAGQQDISITEFDSSGVEQWSATWGGSANDYGRSITQDAAGNYLIAGFSESYGSGADDFVLLKFNSSGQIANCSQCELQTVTEGNHAVSEADHAVTENDHPMTEADQSVTEQAQDPVIMTWCGAETWLTDIDVGTNEVVTDMIQTSDGGTAILGTVNTGSSLDIMLIKLDRLGVEEWTKTIGNSRSDTGGGLVELEDGSLVASVKYDVAISNTDSALVKFNSSGVEQWTKQLGESTTEDAVALARAPDGGFFVGGNKNSDFFVSKFDIDGVEVWSKTIGGGNNEVLYDLTIASDGNIIAVGNTETYGAGGSDFFIVNFDENGAEQWSKSLGTASTEVAHAVTTTSDGGFVVAGRIAVSVERMMIAKFNSSGVEQWSREVGGATGSAIAYDVIETPDGGIVAVGDVSSLGAGGRDQFIVKYNASGTLQWSKTIGQNLVDRADAVMAVDDGGIMVSGFLAQSSIIVAKMDSEGDVDDCSLCVSQTATNFTLNLTEGNQTLTETNRVLTESDLVWAETDRTSTTTEDPFCGYFDYIYRLLGSPNSDSAHDLLQLSDGNILLTGRVSGLGEGDNDMLISKLTPNGTELWSKTIGDFRSNWGYSSVELDNGDIVVAGRNTDVTPDQDFLIVRLNSEGSLIWSKIIGGASDEYLSEIIRTSDNGLLLVGSTASFGAGGDDMFVVKTNESGVEQWSKTLGDTGTERAYGAVETSDGGYVIVGQTQSFFVSINDMFITKINSSGVEQWTKTWGGAGNDIAYGVTEDNNGDLLVAGGTSTYGAGSLDGVVIRFNSSGVEQWTRTIGTTNDESFERIHINNYGNVVAAGYRYTGSQYLMLISSFSISGVEQWSKSYGTGQSFGYDALSLSQGGYMITGSANGSNDIPIVLLNNNGDIPDCSSVFLCSPLTVTEQSHTTAEVNRNITEGDQSLSESNHTVLVNDVTSSTTNSFQEAVLGDSTDIYVSLALENENTRHATRNNPDEFRLRQLLDVSGKRVLPGSQEFKLQYAPRIGTCDTSFSGEVYSDLIPNGNLTSLVNGFNGYRVKESPNDPVSAGGTTVPQVYSEGGIFRNSTTVSSSGESMLFDFAITNPLNALGGTFCFRIVKADGTQLATYSHVAELKTPPVTSQLLRDGQYFGVNEAIEPFFWSSLEWENY